MLGGGSVSGLVLLPLTERALPPVGLDAHLIHQPRADAGAVYLGWRGRSPHPIFEARQTGSSDAMPCGVLLPEFLRRLAGRSPSWGDERTGPVMTQLEDDAEVLALVMLAAALEGWLDQDQPRARQTAEVAMAGFDHAQDAIGRWPVIKHDVVELEARLGIMAQLLLDRFPPSHEHPAMIEMPLSRRLRGHSGDLTKPWPLHRHQPDGSVEAADGGLGQVEGGDPAGLRVQTW